MKNSFKSFSLTLAILWLGHFFVDFMIGIWSIYKTMAGLDLALAGAIAGFCAFVGEGMQIFFGSMSDKGYFKWVLLGGIAAATGAIFIPYAPGYEIFLLCYLITCIGSGAFHPSAVGLLGKLAGPRKGLVISIFATGGSIGMAMSHFLFRDAYLHMGSYIGVLAVPILIFVTLCMLHTFNVDRELYSQSSATPSNHWAIFQYFKRWDLMNVWLVQLCNQVFAWGIIFLLPDVLLSRGYESWITFGGGHFCLVLGAACLMAPAGYLADRFSSRSVLIYGYTCSLILFYIFWAWPQIPSQLVLPLLFILGAALGLLNPICVSLGNKLDPQNPGRVSAFLMGTVWCVSEVIGPAGGGLLTKLFIEDAPANALALLSTVMAGGLLLSFKLPQAEEEKSRLEYA